MKKTRREDINIMATKIERIDLDTEALSVYLLKIISEGLCMGEERVVLSTLEVRLERYFGIFIKREEGGEDEIKSAIRHLMSKGKIIKTKDKERPNEILYKTKEK
jgi:hypothetical protein